MKGYNKKRMPSHLKANIKKQNSKQTKTEPSTPVADEPTKTHFVLDVHDGALGTNSKIGGK